MMEIEFTVMLWIVPNRWCDPLVACDARRAWDDTNLQKPKTILLGEKVCDRDISAL
jgi:hypothetical protein